MYIAAQNKNSVSCVIIIENKRQFTMLYDGRKSEWHCLQACVLKNCDVYSKLLYITILSAVLIISQ
jgi:hypothetical protein